MGQKKKVQNEIYNWFVEHPGYIKKGIVTCYDIYRELVDPNVGEDDFIIAMTKARADFPEYYNGSKSSVKESPKVSYEAKPFKARIKRLYFDIETTPNVVYSWNIGYNLTLDYSNIIKERAIICICYKWEHENKVYEMHWDEGDDKQLIYDFMKVLLEADEVVGHNGDRYDIKFFKTRCVFHGIRSLPEIKSIDTLKISKKEFRFNSNRLDYIGEFLGCGRKIKTDYDLWKRVMALDDEALDEMITYCMQDVRLLQQVYTILSGFSKAKTHVGVLNGLGKHTCPKCGSDNYKVIKKIVSYTGTIKHLLQCGDCGEYYVVSDATLNKMSEE